MSSTRTSPAPALQKLCALRLVKSRTKLTIHLHALDPNSPGYFRLLELHPAGLASGVRCTLFYSSFLEAKYKALSYLWGKPIFSMNIFLSSQAFHITENLYSALNRLRYPNKSRLLWADAIYINQTNVSKRSERVQHMGQIYTNAKMLLTGCANLSHGVIACCHSLKL
jgi:hypothetical protein